MVARCFECQHCEHAFWASGPWPSPEWDREDIYVRLQCPECGRFGSQLLLDDEQIAMLDSDHPMEAHPMSSQADKDRQDHQDKLDKQNAADAKAMHTKETHNEVNTPGYVQPGEAKPPRDGSGTPYPIHKPWAVDTTVPPTLQSLSERFDALEHHFRAIDDRFVQLERELGLHRAKVVGSLTTDKNQPVGNVDNRQASSVR
jgi:hypothetical protein